MGNKKSRKPFLGLKHHDFGTLARRKPALRVGDIVLIEACFLVQAGNIDERRGAIRILNRIRTSDSGQRVGDVLKVSARKELAKLHKLSRSSNGFICVQGLLVIGPQCEKSYLQIIDSTISQWRKTKKVVRKTHRVDCLKILSKWKPRRSLDLIQV